MKMIRAALEDGTRVGINGDAIAFIRKASSGSNEKPGAEIMFVNGQKIRVSQTVDWLLTALGFPPEKKD